jgi:hypothetical protein
MKGKVLFPIVESKPYGPIGLKPLCKTSRCPFGLQTVNSMLVRPFERFLLIVFQSWWD